MTSGAATLTVQAGIRPAAGAFTSGLSTAFGAQGPPGAGAS